MALGSAISLFIYPHSITSVLAAKSKEVIRHNAALLPIYSLLLGFLALLGYCAIAAGIRVRKDSTASFRCSSRDSSPIGSPALPMRRSSSARWCRPPIMCDRLRRISLRATSLPSSRRHARRLRRATREALDARRSALSRCCSSSSCRYRTRSTFQLLGGALMLQIFPAFVFGLWTRWFHPKALLLGWACGIALSCAMAVRERASPRTSRFTPSAPRSPASSRSTR